MKISKLVGAVLVALVAVGLVAPQQAEASSINMDGMGAITSSGGETTFASSAFFVTDSHGPFAPLFGAFATFKPITWTGTGSSAHLVGGPIIGEWVAVGGGTSAQFDFTSLTFAMATAHDLSIIGKGTVFATGSTTLPLRVQRLTLNRTEVL